MKTLWLKLYCVLTLVIALILVSGKYLPTAEADTYRYSTGDYLSYRILEDDTAEITYGGITYENLKIPREINGHIVSSIGEEAFCGNDNFSSVIIPETVTNIGKKAFSHAHSLRDVTLPNSLQTIGESAFDSTSISSITIPSSVTTIGKLAFSSTDIQNVVIPEGVTSIGDRAFEWCKYLTSVTVSGSVTDIGDGAFSSCSKLKKVTLHEGVARLGSGMFVNCYSLTSITLPDSISYIESNPFYWCNGSVKIEISDNHPYLSIFDGVLFTKTDNRILYYPETYDESEYLIPAGTKAIGAYAFSGSKLTSVVIPDSVTCIEYGAFFSSDDLISVTIPDSVVTIGKQAFYSCDRLSSVFIPASVKEIGELCFDLCPNLSVTVIRDSYAEEYCKTNNVNYVCIDNPSEYHLSDIVSDTQPGYRVGDMVFFGHYEQDNDLTNGKEAIEWQVVDVQDDGSYILVSRYALDEKKFNEEYVDVTWKTSTLRKWLNEDFFNTAFSTQEQTVIEATDDSSKTRYGC